MAFLPKIHKADYLVLLSTLVLFLSVFIGVSLVQRQQQIRQAKAAATWFVSKNGNNSDGRSWSTAWNELNKINWSLVRPGDSVLIDGGATACPSLGANYSGSSCGMVYNTPLVVGASGTSSAPIIIRLAPDSGRNGTVIIDGGVVGSRRCPGYPGEQYPTGSIPSSPGNIDPNNPIKIGFDMESSNWIVVDGTKWGGIEIRNTHDYGFNFNQSQNVKAGYLKIHHVRGLGSTRLVMQRPNSSNNTLLHSELFGGGQDGVHGAGDNFVMEYNYIHDLYCYHPDGIQSHAWPGYDDGGPHGEIKNFVIRYNIFENIGNLVDNSGFHGMGIFLGETSTGAIAWVNGADIHDNLIVDIVSASIRTKHPDSTNIRVYKNTIVNSQNVGIQWCCGGATIPLTISDNIFSQAGKRDGAINVPTNGGKTAFVNNCVYDSGGIFGDVSESGTINANPLFVDAANGNYDLKSGSPCAGKGSSISSVAKLVGQPPPSPPPQPPTKTPTPTKSPTLTPPTTLPGDLDKDRDVDIFDYNIMLENFGKTNCGNVADINGNCKVDIFDYNILIENFGKTG